MLYIMSISFKNKQSLELDSETSGINRKGQGVLRDTFAGLVVSPKSSGFFSGCFVCMLLAALWYYESTCWYYGRQPSGRKRVLCQIGLILSPVSEACVVFGDRDSSSTSERHPGAISVVCIALAVIWTTLINHMKGDLASYTGYSF